MTEEKIQEKPKCGHLVSCFDNTKRPCVRDKDHEGGHNPFSDTQWELVKSGKVEPKKDA